MATIGYFLVFSLISLDVGYYELFLYTYFFTCRETYVPKTILGTTVKLNGSNYLLWAQTFCIFIGAQNKLDHLLESLPATTNLTYTTGFLENIIVVF